MSKDMSFFKRLSGFIVSKLKEGFSDKNFSLLRYLDSFGIFSNVKVIGSSSATGSSLSQNQCCDKEEF